MKILNRLLSDMKIDTNKPLQSRRQHDKEAAVSRFTHEEEQIKAIFDKHKQPLSKENMNEIKLFISKSDGNLDSKMKTIENGLTKGIEMTSDNLSAVHKALNGDIEDVVNKLSSNPLEVKKVYSMLPKELKEAVDLKLSEGLSLKEAVRKVIKSELKNLFVESENTIITEENGASIGFSDDVDVVEIFTEAETEYKEMNKSNKSDINDPIERSSIDKPDNGKTDYGIIKTVETALEFIEDEIDELLENIDGNIQIENLVNIDRNTSFKKIIRTEITEKMVELKKEFKTYKKIIDNQLDKLINEKSVVLDMKESLNSVIDKLDRILMKSDITLYTDMKTERDLLSSSSKLDDARNLLDKGDAKEAVEIVKTVKALINQIDFKPSEQKILGVSQKMFLEKLYDAEIMKSVPVMINTDPQVSPRAVLEILRGLGLNHESEVSELLNKEKNEGAVKCSQNMKTILMKLDEDATQRVRTREGLENLTGQQLMNKLEYKSQKQKLLFNMPIKIDNDVKNLKIHVNAKKDNQKIDWKNSTLYFVIHLEKLGDTGVLVDVNNGQLNLTIKNDTPNIESKMRPLVDSAMERLESVGFSHFTLKFDRLEDNAEEVIQKQESELNKYDRLNKEGFDVKI